MSYSIHTTEGIVLRSFSYGESDRVVYIFTDEMGLIRASAKSARALKSKLRFGLADFSRSTFSLVRGKNEWRVTDAKIIENLFSAVANNSYKNAVIARIFLLLNHICHDGEDNRRLFNLLTNSFGFLNKNIWDEKSAENFETILVMRILGDLGFMKTTPVFDEILSSDNWSAELLQEIDGKKVEAVSLINDSLHGNHLVRL